MRHFWVNVPNRENRENREAVSDSCCALPRVTTVVARARGQRPMTREYLGAADVVARALGQRLIEQVRTVTVLRHGRSTTPRVPQYDATAAARRRGHPATVLRCRLRRQPRVDVGLPGRLA